MFMMNSSIGHNKYTSLVWAQTYKRNKTKIKNKIISNLIIFSMHCFQDLQIQHYHDIPAAIQDTFKDGHTELSSWAHACVGQRTIGFKTNVT